MLPGLGAAEGAEGAEGIKPGDRGVTRSLKDVGKGGVFIFGEEIRCPR